ncbi:MAG: two-component regulator propeller domain-containing protein [Flavobacteriales bacterium]
MYGILFTFGPVGFLSKYILGFIFACVLTQPVWSQRSFKNYTTANGLPSNTVYCAFSDSKGYLWFSTEQGVARYDGNNFKVFTIDDGLTDNEVFRIFEDSKGRIWFLTYNGKLCFYQNNHFSNETNCDFLKGAKSASFFTQVIEDKDHTLWFVRHGGNIYARLQNNTLTQQIWPDNCQLISVVKHQERDYLVFASKADDTQTHYRFASLHEPGKEIMGFTHENDYSYFFSHGKYIVYGGKSKSTQQIEFHKIPDLDITKTEPINVNSDCTGDKIYGAAEHEGKWYVNTNYGVYVFDSQLQFIQKTLDSVAVTFVCSDFENGLWFTTKHRGVYFVKKETTIPYSSIGEEIRLIRKNPYNSNDIYFVGVENVYRIKNDMLQTIRLPLEFGKNETVADLAFLDAETVLLGSGYGMCMYNGKTFEVIKKHNGVKQFLIEGDSVLVARSSGIAIQHKNQLRLPNNQNPQPYKTLYASRTLCVLRTDENKLLYGDNDGAYILRTHPEAIKTIFSRIKHMYQSKSGDIACCSDINGVFVKRASNVKHYTKTNGLISNYVNNVVFDSHDNLWVATNKGLSYIQIRKNKITNFGLIQGLADEKINDVYVINDSTLLLAASTGLYLFNPLKKTIPPKPRIEVEHIKVNGQLVTEAAIKHLNVDQNNLEIRLSGISFYDNNLEFYFKIEDADWIKADGRTLTLIDVPAGDFNVKMKGKSMHNRESNIRDLNITIIAPSNKKWWLLLSSVVVVLLVVSLLVYRYLRRKKARVN